MSSAFEVNVLNDADSAQALLGRGKLYLGALDATTGLVDTNGFVDIGNVNNFSLNLSTERVQRINFRECLAVQDLDLVVSQIQGVSLTANDATADNLARYLSGTATDAGYTSTLGTGVTNKVLGDSGTGGAGITPGRWYELRDANDRPLLGMASGDLTVNFDSADTFATESAGVLNTDYELDSDHGLVRVLASGLYGTGDVFVRFTSAAGTNKSYDLVEMLDSTPFNGWVKFLGCNANGDREFQLDLFKVLLSSDGDFPLIGQEISEMSFSGSCNSNTAAKTALAASSSIGRIYEISGAV